LVGWIHLDDREKARGHVVVDDRVISGRDHEGRCMRRAEWQRQSEGRIVRSGRGGWEDGRMGGWLDVKVEYAGSEERGKVVGKAFMCGAIPEDARRRPFAVKRGNERGPSLVVPQIPARERCRTWPIHNFSSEQAYEC
jgi:hypothetical protein